RKHDRLRSHVKSFFTPQPLSHLHTHTDRVLGCPSGSRTPARGVHSPLSRGLSARPIGLRSSGYAHGVGLNAPMTPFRVGPFPSPSPTPGGVSHARRRSHLGLCARGAPPSAGL